MDMYGGEFDNLDNESHINVSKYGCLYQENMGAN